jgi:gas vesicle protein
MSKIMVPISFTLGLLVGASTAALYAPHSGKITRNKLKNKYEEKLETLNEKIIDIQELADGLKSKLS